ncbi:prostate-associated microseminoprotein-like [Pristis pectinata]|uniref:prostate-associated microseminoprotein-like n=1 Tax=Pristis pectinata TaxID=685728 RepID=UPI00223CB5CE|nr:prostate-associated microseminoprotein-like [Pristis pectinata]
MERDVRSARQGATHGGSGMGTEGPSLCLIIFLLLPATTGGAGECFFNAKATCGHRGVELQTGDTWVTEDCYQCVCLSPFGVGCCDSIQQPVDYPEWCQLVQRPESCRLELVMKANPGMPCIDNSAANPLHPGRARKGEKGPWF